MPRKQRFKPSRKPKPAPPSSESTDLRSDPRPEVHPDDVGQEAASDAPERDPSPPSAERDIEERSR